MGALVNPAGCLKCLLVGTGYCIFVLERCIKYMSKNAYIQISLTTKSFCPAAKDAFALILKNAMKFGFANSIGNVFMVFGCFFICACTSLCTYMYMTTQGVLEVTSPIPTTVVMGFIAIGIGY